MKNTKFAAVTIVGLCCGTSLLNAATTLSYSFWGYDQYAGSSPFYQHYQITPMAEPDRVVAKVDLLDSGWGFHPVSGWSSYHVFPFVENFALEIKPLRTVGWHQYEFLFDTVNDTGQVFMDGNLIGGGFPTGNPELFRFGFHNYQGTIQENVIDDFVFKVDGNVAYQQGFEGSSFDAYWSAMSLDPKLYASSGDISRPHSGLGALALGASSTGQAMGFVVFDSTLLTAVPEPSTTFALGTFLALGLTIRQRKLTSL